VPGGFAAIYQVLRAMEESGQCRRGYFVEGLGAAQFALPGAVDRMRALANPLNGAAGDRSRNALTAVVLAAADPAQPYGAALPWPDRPISGEQPPAGQTSAGQASAHRSAQTPAGQALAAHRSGQAPVGQAPAHRSAQTPAGQVPVAHRAAQTPAGQAPAGQAPAHRSGQASAGQVPVGHRAGQAAVGHRPGRKAGALVVLADGALALYVERGGRTLLSWTDDPDVLGPCAAALAAAVRAGALGRLTVERADGAGVYGSPLAQALEAAGFRPTPRGLRLRAG
jgi:ATP-dependent Lhr-like helicase